MLRCFILQFLIIISRSTPLFKYSLIHHIPWPLLSLLHLLTIPTSSTSLPPPLAQVQFHVLLIHRLPNLFSHSLDLFASELLIHKLILITLRLRLARSRREDNDVLLRYGDKLLLIIFLVFVVFEHFETFRVMGSPAFLTVIMLRGFLFRGGGISFLIEIWNRLLLKLIEAILYFKFLLVFILYTRIVIIYVEVFLIVKVKVGLSGLALGF